MECTECKYKKQLAIKRCKKFELGGDKKKKVCFELVIVCLLVLAKVLFDMFQGQMIQF